jgi:hypothetical protein
MMMQRPVTNEALPEGHLLFETFCPAGHDADTPSAIASASWAPAHDAMNWPEASPVRPTEA